MEIPETKRFIPERFELDTTLSLLTWSMFDDETISNENLFETVMSGSFKGLYLVLHAKQNTMNELQLRKTVEGAYIIWPIFRKALPLFIRVFKLWLSETSSLQFK